MFERFNLPTCEPSNNSCRAIRYQHNQGDHQKNQPNRPRKTRGQDLASMFDVEFGSSRKFSLVNRLHTLFFVPPGAAAVEVGSNI